MTNYIIEEEKLFGRKPETPTQKDEQAEAAQVEAAQADVCRSDAAQADDGQENDGQAVRRSHKEERIIRRSGCSVALFWFSVIYWFFSILCCAGALFIGWELGNTVREGISENPFEIREETLRFFGSIELPPIFKPAMSLTFKQPFSGTPVFFGAVYTYSNPHQESAISDVITVGTFSSYLSEELRATFQRRLSTQIAINESTSEIIEESTLPVHIGGTPYTFDSVLSKTRDGRQMRTLSGLFRNKAGEPAFILISVDPQTVTNHEINQIIQSLNK